MAGPWLRYRGHLDNISNNCLIGAVNAFGEIKDAFNVFLYNWVQINKLRSIHKRLSEFELAINFKGNVIVGKDLLQIKL